MEAKKLKTVDDLFNSTEERLELINGELIQRPMARFEHGASQAGTYGELLPIARRKGHGGWWIVTEVNVKYGEHHCPCHDLAGWRKERVKDRPSGVIDIIPDWVCEITSPGHEKKDLMTNFMLLQNYGVGYYWIVSPEDRTLIAYQLVDGKYHVIFSGQFNKDEPSIKVRIQPFSEIEIDLGFIFGDQ